MNAEAPIPFPQSDWVHDQVSFDRKELGQILRVYGVEGSFHSVIKEAMVLLGQATTATVRSPALPLTPESRSSLRMILERAGLLAAPEKD